MQVGTKTKNKMNTNKELMQKIHQRRNLNEAKITERKAQRWRVEPPKRGGETKRVLERQKIRSTYMASERESASSE